MNGSWFTTSHQSSKKQDALREARYPARSDMLSPLHHLHKERATKIVLDLDLARSAYVTYIPSAFSLAAMNRLTFFVFPFLSSTIGLASSSSVGLKPPCCWMNLLRALWYSA